MPRLRSPVRTRSSAPHSLDPARLPCGIGGFGRSLSWAVSAFADSAEGVRSHELIEALADVETVIVAHRVVVRQDQPPFHHSVGVGETARWAAMGLIAEGRLAGCVAGPDHPGVDAISYSNGIGTLITGALSGVCSMLLLNGQRKRWVGLLLSIIAVVALILTIYSIADIINTSDGIPNNLIERFPNIDPAYANKAKLDLGTGVWLALGGSVASLFAGISGFKRNA